MTKQQNTCMCQLQHSLFRRNDEACGQGFYVKSDFLFFFNLNGFHEYLNQLAVLIHQPFFKY